MQSKAHVCRSNKCPLLKMLLPGCYSYTCIRGTIVISIHSFINLEQW